MKHERLMKRPKRFCVDCNREQFVTSEPHKTFIMYHCGECKAEVGRAGDGLPAKAVRRVAGGIDVNSFPNSFLGGKSSEVLASEYPDVLSDEHAMWHPRDADAEEEREDRLRNFKLALCGLTARQMQILDAVDIYRTHEKAAAALGVSQQSVSKTVEQIRKKLLKHSCDADKQG